MAADSQTALEEFMEQIPEEELEAALELEDYSIGSDRSEGGQGRQDNQHVPPRTGHRTGRRTGRTGNWHKK